MDTDNQNPRTTPDDPGLQMAFALVCVGHHLQAAGIQIQVQPGEAYPQAARRVINRMPSTQRERWWTGPDGVGYYIFAGPEHAPSSAIRRRWLPAFCKAFPDLYPVDRQGFWVPSK